jgi:site-specific recombinase XerD
MLFQEAYDKFLNWLEVIKNKSPKTVEQYDRHLRYFMEYLKIKMQDNIDVVKIDLDLAE